MQGMKEYELGAGRSDNLFLALCLADTLWDKSALLFCFLCSFQTENGYLV